MIKVKLAQPNLIKVRLLPPQGINVDLKTTYLYDPDWIPAINNAITDAYNYAESAKDSSESAEASANSAAESARNADADADNASESAGLAAQEAQKAIDASTNATQEADAAAESAYQSQQSALAAYEYAQNASSDAENALESLEHVLASVAEAKTSELNAKTSELNAKDSETKAKASETKATQEANASAESAYQAQQSALAAYEYASNADADAQNVNETLELVLESEQTCRASASTSNANAIMAENMKNQATQQANRAAQQANIATEKADESSQFALECQEIKNSLGSVYKFKGSVSTFSQLPLNAEVGDVYDVIDSGVNYAWNGSEWDSLGASVDLSLYATKEDLSAVEDELDLYAKKEYISDFRGSWENYTSVPENSNSYPLDEYNSRTPTFNDYLIVKDAGDYFVSSSKNLLETDFEGVNVSSTPASSVLVNFNAWYMGVAYNGYMGSNVPISSFSSDKGKISFKSASSDSYGVCKFVQLSPNTTYTLSAKSGGRAAITGMSDEGGGYYKFSSFISTPKALPLTFTTREQSVVAIIFYASSNQEEVVYDEIQLEVGSSATSYEVAGGYYLNGTWRFRYSGDWDANGKSGWIPEYEVGNDLSDYATTEYVNTTEQEIIENFMEADTSLQTQITGLSGVLAEEQNKIEAIEGKIPTNASSSNLLSTASDLLNATQDVRADFAESDSELQTQINGQATVLAELKTGKQDKLTAGENITIENNVISASGGSADKITNCITEIPQDIKLELTVAREIIDAAYDSLGFVKSANPQIGDGVYWSLYDTTPYTTITSVEDNYIVWTAAGGYGELKNDIKGVILKAGSKVYVPNGSGKFDEKTLSSDISITNLTYNTTYLLFTNTDATFLFAEYSSSCSSGTTQPSGTWKTWYDTTNNKIKRFGNTEGTVLYEGSLPIARITVSNGEISFIDEVFNGFGYIGSTVFALPGLKGLIPNGRNKDGSLKNTVVEITAVATKNYSGTQELVWGFTSGNNIYYQTQGAVIYDEKKNTTNWQTVIFASGYVSGGTTISNFVPKTTFHAVDYNDAMLINGDQDIGGNKNFIDGLTKNGEDVITSSGGTINGNISLKDNQTTVAPATTTWHKASIQLYDKNNVLIGYIQPRFNSDGTVDLYIAASDPTNGAKALVLNSGGSLKWLGNPVLKYGDGIPNYTRGIGISGIPVNGTHYQFKAPYNCYVIVSVSGTGTSCAILSSNQALIDRSDVAAQAASICGCSAYVRQGDTVRFACNGTSVTANYFPLYEVSGG